MSETPKTCPLCGGEQWLYKYDGDELVATACKCLERELLKAYLGPEIYNAKRIKSELFYRDNQESEIKDRTKDNLFITGAWPVVCQHLRWVLSAKRLHSPGFTFEILKDVRLLKVWLGDEAYLHKPKNVRDNIKTYNNLLELLPHPTLVIIHLGFVERNKAMANIFHEALKTRAALPTWVVEGDKKFTFNHSAYNAEVQHYLQEHFKTIDLGGDVEGIREAKFEATKEAFDFDVVMGPDVETPEARDFFGGYKPRHFKKGHGNGSSGLPELK